ncbi:hypothetical protein B0H14DRAFT_3434440 [Mycena olivaceomarginata]|nr:hypothetical protein B0H14DRAFT_3434440 [Mycena olivaceomarginata]
MAAETGGTRSHMLHKAKEKVQRTWVKERKAAPRTGSFAIVNRFPPSLKPTPHFNSLDPEAQDDLFLPRMLTACAGKGFKRASTYLIQTDISLPEILGTKDVIAALAKFLEESGAFTKSGTTRRLQELHSFDEPDPVESDNESDDGG